MDILFVLIPLSLSLVAAGCWAFFWAVDAGQFDDLDSSGWDIVADDTAPDEQATIAYSTDRREVPQP